MKENEKEEGRDNKKHEGGEETVYRERRGRRKSIGGGREESVLYVL